LRTILQASNHQPLGRVIVWCQSVFKWGGICVSSVRTLSFSTSFAQFETQFVSENATQISGNVICNFQFSILHNQVSSIKNIHKGI
jgi:hypothetical protein